MAIVRKVGEQRDANLWDDLHPNRWLKAGLLGGKPRTLTIERVYTELMDGKKEGETEWQAIVSFSGTERELALNRTNRECFKAALGVNVKEWIGKRITLVVDQDRDPTNGGKCDCIRVSGSPDMTHDIEAVWVVHAPRKGPRTCRRMLRPTGKAPVGRTVPAATVVDDPYRAPPVDPENDGREPETTPKT